VYFFSPTKASSQRRMPESPPPTLYDETYRSISYPEPCIGSIANNPNLVGRLEHHSPTTDGSFSICIASGRGVFISQVSAIYIHTHEHRKLIMRIQSLYESIPTEHRPPLNSADAGRTVNTIATSPMKTIGSTFMPIILTNKDTLEKFRIVLYALVVPNLFMGMFISDWPLVRTTQWSSSGPTFGLGFDETNWDSTINVKGI